MSEHLVPIGCDAFEGQYVTVRVPNESFIATHGDTGTVIGDDAGAGALYVHMDRTGHEAHVDYEYVYAVACIPPEGMTFHTSMAGNAVATCSHCTYKCVYWECACELDHICTRDMLA